MTVLMTTNYADGRHRGQTGEQGIQGERGERPWHDARPPSLSVLLQEAASLSVCRPFRERSRMAYASKCGDSCGRPLRLRVGRARCCARCSRTVDFNFPRKSLRHAPCAAAADTRRRRRRRQKAAFCFTLEFLDRRWYLLARRG